MAQIANPRKQFNFSIFCPGLNPFLAQKVTTPDIEIEEVTHGDTNHDIKTGGRLKVGSLNVDKISPATASDSWVFDWMNTIQNALLGGGALPSIYKRQITIEEYSTDGITVLNTHDYEGAWPKKRNGIELSRTQSENTLQSIEFAVDIPIIK
jgi:hypothetical protein